MNSPNSKLTIVIILLGAAGGMASAQGNEQYAHEFRHNFRGNELPAEIEVVGRPRPEFLKEDKDGFRITLPNDWIHESGGVSCRTKFGLKGDFQITGTYDILHADVPQKGYGVGASLYLNQGEPENVSASIARVVRNGGNQILVWDRVPQKEKGKNAGGVVKCKDTVLRLRLKRVGRTLHYQWAPGLEGDNFIEIKVAEEFGDSDITAVRMSAITGREPCRVDVRFLDFHIGSGGMKEGKGPNAAPFVPQPIEADQPVQVVHAARIWLCVVAIIGLVLVVSLAGIAVFLMRRKKSVPTPAAPVVQMISFHCLACGKTLKAKVSAVGKKIKCIKCGNVSLVPARDAIQATDA